ncbi:MAG: DUF3365 domain-containing protein [Planctomycetaceae bacterium]
MSTKMRWSLFVVLSLLAAGLGQSFAFEPAGPASTPFPQCEGQSGSTTRPALVADDPVECQKCRNRAAEVAALDESRAIAVESHLPEHAQSQAIAARDALFTKLSGRLMEVMQADGPAAAISVCSQEAGQIAQQVGKEQGVQIGRTSFQLRNDKNQPPAWARWFVDNHVDATQFINLPEGQTGALLPIRLQAKCLVCHGSKDQIPAMIQTKLQELYPNDHATGFQEGDLRGWFWVVVPPAEAVAATADPHAHGDEPASEQAAEGADAAANSSRSGPPFGRGMGRGFGRGAGGPGMGAGGGNRPDMTTIHAMFAAKEKITRKVTLLDDGAEAVTESDDPALVALIQEHVPAMESRIHEDRPLPPMTFHPVFVELRKHADDYTLDYEETGRGIKVRYKAEDPFVIMLVQEHSQLVSRFLKNGMEEIHKEYKLPAVPGR